MACFCRCCAESSDASTEVVDVSPQESIPSKNVFGITNADDERGTAVPSEAQQMMGQRAETQPGQLAQAQEDRPRRLQLSMTKAALTDDLGAIFDVADNRTFVIDGLQPGLFSTWNAQNPTQAVSPGDRIMSVNGLKGDVRAMLDKMKGEMQLNLEVVQPQTAELTIKRDASGLLGIELSLLPKKGTVVILAVKDGPVLEWATANGRTIHGGDRIVSANGISGNADKIAKALVQSNSSGDIALTVWRYG